VKVDLFGVVFELIECYGVVLFEVVDVMVGGVVECFGVEFGVGIIGLFCGG